MTQLRWLWMAALCCGLSVPTLGQEAPGSYSGELFTRSTLTGDWLDVRNDLGARGVTFDASVTQVEQGVVSGGKDEIWDYGGRGDLTGNVDTGKLGLWPGGFLTVELEGNWGSSVNRETGALMAVNSNQLFPSPKGSNVGLPDLSFVQFVSQYVGILAGKVQTVSGSDENEFAHGKGGGQFFNLAFNFNPTVLLVPYSTLAAGAVVLPTGDPNDAIVSLSVLSATGNASTSGFDDLNGAIFAGEGRLRTDVFGRTGHQLLGALYSNKEYTSMDQRIASIVGNQPLAQQDGSWAMYYNFDQYLFETKKGEHGVGVFGRFGASNGNPNVVQYFFSSGVGGKGFIPTRSDDQCGLGFYYADVRNPTLQHPRSTTSLLRDEWGLEGYYDLALTPWLILSPDLQVIRSSQKQEISAYSRRSIGTATVIGVRLRIIL